MIELSLSFFIFLIGTYGLINGKNIVKSIICLNLVQTSVIIIFILLTRSSGKGLPIHGFSVHAPIDPLPQALIITAIVIGASITALALMMAVKIFHYYGSLEWKVIMEREKK